MQLSVLLEENTRLQNAMRRSSSTEFPVEGLTLGKPSIPWAVPAL